MTLVTLLRDLRRTLLEPGVLAGAPDDKRAAAHMLLSQLGKWLDRLPPKSNPERIPHDALNAARAKRGGRAIAAYLLNAGVDDDGTTAFVDLLTDLMHWGAANGIAVDEALWSAQNHASAEGLKEVSP